MLPQPAPTLLTPCTRGLLDLRFHYQPALRQTALEVVAQTPPLRVVRAFPLPGGAALAHLHNISGGVLGGDALDLHLSVEAQAQAQLTTPSATRIYRHRPGLPDASQQTRVEVGPGAVLEYLPDPLIPFAQARYHQRTRIQLAPDAGLFWWETIAPGREARGERFAYDSLDVALEITTGERLIALERYRLQPREASLSSLARLGTYLYHTTFYICRAGATQAMWSALEDELGLIARQYTESGDSLWGVSILPSDGIVLRGVSNTHRFLSAQLVGFWRTAKQTLYGTEINIPRKNY